MIPQGLLQDLPHDLIGLSPSGPQCQLLPFTDLDILQLSNISIFDLPATV